ncbi:hypothetical protein PsorP6_001364 [Peronosclerospora sorghi]|uniref:Uncharacterized protein n=1 Tax=Peronosclerospora sorghi TaxID=230839 RepID=A0ACC0WS48_9STRA|nr:hypothetical protein PsorP6_001364 [Peronosclerospora sorghi]
MTELRCRSRVRTIAWGTRVASISARTKLRKKGCATRRAIAEQLRHGDELRRKINNVTSDEDDENDEYNEIEEQDMARVEKRARSLVNKIDVEHDDAKKERGFQGMKFMQLARL